MTEHILSGRGLIAQQYNFTQGFYHNRWQPFVAYWGAGWSLFFTLFAGFQVFWKFDGKTFVIACKPTLVQPRRSLIFV